MKTLGLVLFFVLLGNILGAQEVYNENFEGLSLPENWFGGEDWMMENGHLKHKPLTGHKSSFFTHEMDTTDLLYKKIEWLVTLQMGYLNVNNNFRFYLFANHPDVSLASKSLYFSVTDYKGLNFTVVEDGPGGSFNFGKVSQGWTNGTVYQFRIICNAPPVGLSVEMGERGEGFGWVQGSNKYTLSSQFLGEKLYSGLYFEYNSSGKGRIWLDDLVLTMSYREAKYTGLEVVEGKGCVLRYSIPIEEGEFTDLRNYKLRQDDRECVIDSVRMINRTSILLYTTLQTGKYFVEVADMKAVSGSVVSTGTQSFSYIQPADEGDLCFNEVMFRLKTGVQLPLPRYEYVEIYNRRDYAVRLDSVVYKCKDVETWIVDTIPANSFLILCFSAGVKSLSAYGDVHLMRGSSLDDEEGTVMLETKKGAVFDSLHYRSEWFRDAEKQKGGWSLERIDPLVAVDPEVFNWYESQAAEGGTPGGVNSVYGTKPDEVEPWVSSFRVEGDSCLVVGFSEGIYSEGGRFSVRGENGEGEFLGTVRWMRAEEVRLRYGGGFPRNQSYVLTVSGLMDFSGNRMADTVLRFLIPGIVESGDVQISELLFEAEPSDAEYVELYNGSDKRIFLSDLKIGKRGTKGELTALKNLTDSCIIFEPGSLVWVCSDPAAIKMRFLYHNPDNCVVIQTMPQFTDKSGTVVVVRKDSLIVDSFTYAQSDHHPGIFATKGVALERIHLDVGLVPVWMSAGCDPTNGYGSPGFPNRALGEIFSRLEIVSDHVVRFYCSVPLNTITAVDMEHYRLRCNDEEVLVDRILPHGAFTVDVFLSLKTGDYSLTVSDLEDVSGVVLSAKEFHFNYIGKAFPGDFVLNEIMFHPTDGMGLPKEEYLELYNCRDYAIRLDSVAYEYRGKREDYLRDTIGGRGYLILCASSGSVDLSAYGRICKVKNFSLIDTATSLVFRTKEGLLFDSVYYRSEWVREVEKQKGGWSLERIDPLMAVDPEVFNWYESQAAEGGTPGGVNSVYGTTPDEVEPWVSSFRVEGDSCLVVGFSEGIYSEGGRFSVRGENGEGEFSGVVRWMRAEEVRLRYGGGLPRNQSYVLTVSGLMDFSGNRMADTVLRFLIPGIVESGDVQISELLFEAEPSDAEYVELYNGSDKRIFLSDLKIGKRGTKGELTALKNLTDSCIIFEPGSLVWVCSNPAAIKMRFLYHNPDNCVVIQTMPQFTDKSGTVIVVRKDSVVVDEFFYDRSFHSPALKQVIGVSLERLNTHSEGMALWTSAGGNQEEGYGSPGLPNRACAQISSFIEVMDDRVVRLFCNVPMDIQKSGDIENYTLLCNGRPVAIDGVQATDSLSVTLLARLQTGIYVLTVRGLLDIGGGEIPAVNITFSHISQAGRGDVVLNEIMFHPLSGLGLPKAEYLELYNCRDYAVRLDSVVYEYRGKVEDYLQDTIRGNSYLILCALSDVDSLSAFGDIFHVKNFSLTDTGACLVFRTKAGILLDSVCYCPEWIREIGKRRGGWSLERAKTADVYPSVSNWYESVAAVGGTPGGVNSVYKVAPDLVLPEVVSCRLVNDRQIVLIFSKNMDSGTAGEKQNYRLSGEYEVPERILMKQNEVNLWYAAGLEYNKSYSLQVSGLQDFVGNRMRDTTLEFFLFAKVEQGDVLLSEVLYDAEPADGEYIELYNNSDKRICLNDLRIGKKNDKQEWSLIKRVADSCVVLEPGCLVWICSDPEGVKSRYVRHNPDNCVKINAMLQLSNGGGTVAVMRADTMVVDELVYFAGLHSADITKTKGVALERTDYSLDGGSVFTWNSAGGDPVGGYGSPGLKNSSERKEEREEGDEISGDLISVLPEVFTPDGDAYEDEVEICATNQGREFTLKLLLYTSGGRLVRMLADGVEVRRQNCFKWNGTAGDERLLPAGIYVVYAEIIFTGGEKKLVRKICVLSR